MYACVFVCDYVLCMCVYWSVCVCMCVYCVYTCIAWSKIDAWKEQARDIESFRDIPSMQRHREAGQKLDLSGTTEYKDVSDAIVHQKVFFCLVHSKTEYSTENKVVHQNVPQPCKTLSGVSTSLVHKLLRQSMGCAQRWFPIH